MFNLRALGTEMSFFFSCYRAEKKENVDFYDPLKFTSFVKVVNFKMYFFYHLFFFIFVEKIYNKIRDFNANAL